VSSEVLSAVLSSWFISFHINCFSDFCLPYLCHCC